MGMADPRLKQLFDDTMSKAMSRPATCMHPRCNNKAIKSHILQKSLILKPIAPKNQLYCFQPNSSFNPQILHYRKVGINSAMTYQGFCNEHDCSIFKPIENKNVDWSNIHSQYILGYRTVCRELDIKQRMFLFFKIMYPMVNPALLNYYFYSLKGLKSGIDDLKTYKKIIENGVFNHDYTGYSFQTIVSDYFLELCISSSVTVSYSKIINKDIVDADLIELNIINIFPFNGKSIIIVGFANHCENIWAHDLVKKIQNVKSFLEYSKILNDLILFRTEFNCMSEKLYNSIPENEMQQFLREYKENENNRSVRLTSDLNLFHTFVEQVTVNQQ